MEGRGIMYVFWPFLCDGWGIDEVVMYGRKIVYHFWGWELRLSLDLAGDGSVVLAFSNGTVCLFKA